MSKKDNFQERRKHKRFEAKRGAFAVLPPYFNKLGEVKDISKGGLSIHYLVDVEQTIDPLEIELYSFFDNSYLRRLSVTTISDIAVTKTTSLNSLATRRLSVQFGNLSHSQRQLLGHFQKKLTHK